MPEIELKKTKQFINEKWDEFTKKIQAYFQDVSSEIEKLNKQITKLRLLDDILTNGKNDFGKIFDNQELLIQYDPMLNRFIDALKTYESDTRNSFALLIADKILLNDKLQEELGKIENLKIIVEQLKVQYKETSKLIDSFKTHELNIDLIEKFIESFGYDDTTKNAILFHVAIEKALINEKRENDAKERLEKTVEQVNIQIDGVLEENGEQVYIQTDDGLEDFLPTDEKAENKTEEKQEESTDDSVTISKENDEQANIPKKRGLAQILWV